MDYKFFVNGVKTIIFNPSGAWQTIDRQNKNVKFVRDSLLLPLLILVSISSFAGSLLFRNTEMSTSYSVFIGIRTFIELYITVYLSAYLLGEITYPLDLGKDFSVSFNIITFSFVPFLVCQIFSSLFESLLFVNVIALYGLYIFWEGAEKYMNPPKYKKMPLLIAATVCSAGIWFISNKMLTSLFDRIFYAFFD